MRLTNYENSKRLAELNFKADYIFFYDRDGILRYKYSESDSNYKEYECAYDLETLLDALPWCIEVCSELFDLEIDELGLLYKSQEFSSFCFFKEDREIYVLPRKVSCSLADCAARLLIKLIEQGIVKMGGK